MILCRVLALLRISVGLLLEMDGQQDMGYIYFYFYFLLWIYGSSIVYIFFIDYTLKCVIHT